MTKTHIVHAFDKDLEKVKALLLEMGGLVENQLSLSVRAVVSRDAVLGEKVRKTDRRINELEQKINEKSVRLLALRQPMAQDLRIIVAVMKAASNLERIGDYAKNVAKRSSVLARFPPVGSAANTLARMNDLVLQMIVDVLDAFIGNDVPAAEDVRLRDEDVDLMHNSLFRELLTYMMEDPRNISPCMHLLFIAKNIERSGDHIVQIAEQIHYLVEGKFPEQRRPKGDRTSTMVVEMTREN